MPINEDDPLNSPIGALVSEPLVEENNEGDIALALTAGAEEPVATDAPVAPIVEAVLDEAAVTAPPAITITPDIGLVTTTTEAPAAVAEAVVAVTMTANERVLAHIQSILPNVTVLSPAIQSIVQNMESFVGAMGPRQVISPETGARFQRQLYNTILSATRLDEWQIALEVILYYFAAYRTEHFEDRMLVRFMDVIRFTRKDMLCFSALVHLFASGADPKGRSMVAQQVDFKKLSEMLPDNNARERMMAMFKF